MRAGCFRGQRPESGVLVADDLAGRVVGAVVEAVRTGRVGDGEVWVASVNSVVRVRAGERGIDALQMSN